MPSGWSWLALSSRVVVACLASACGGSTQDSTGSSVASGAGGKGGAGGEPGAGGEATGTGGASSGGAASAGGAPATGGAPAAGGSSACPPATGETTLVTPYSGLPGALAVDATHVYFASAELGASLMATLRKVSRSGGPSETLFIGSNWVGQTPIVTDGASVYWAENFLGNISRIDVSGGAPVTVASGQANPNTLALSGTSLYWSNRDDGSIRRSALDGSGAVVLTSGHAGVTAIAVDATHVYWTTIDDVMKVPIDGGTPVRLAADGNHGFDVAQVVELDGQGRAPAGPSSLAVDGESVYWTNAATGTVRKIGLDGGTPADLASGQTDPCSIAVRGSHVYWATPCGPGILEPKYGRLMRAPVTGGAPSEVCGFSPKDGISAFVLDGNEVYSTWSGGVWQGYVGVSTIE